MSLFLFLRGGSRLSVPAASAAEVFDLCLRCGLSYTDLARDGEGNLTFSLSRRAARRLLTLAEARECRPAVLSEFGLPVLLARLLVRPGLIAGLLLSLCLLLLSGSVVWDVRVTGNTTLSGREVRETLKACGFGIGSPIAGTDIGELETRVLISSDRIAWISVYLDGTVARVQIIEREEEAPPETPSRAPANLVAAADGQIEYLELYRGNAVVTAGQAVKKGELLVSGLYDSQVEGYRYTRAAGRVLARTERNFSVSIPLTYEKKCYSEPILTEMTLKFFDFPVKIFKRGGNPPSECDIIEKESAPESSGAPALPFSVVSQYAYPYTEEIATRTGEEALTLAYAELERRLSAATEGMQLLSKTVTTTLTDTALLLECRITVIEDIAVQAEFEINETDGKEPYEP